MNVRVLLISHSCQVRSQGQPRAEHLAAMPGIDLRVLVPDRWYEYGQLRHPRMPEPCPFDYEVGKVRWPWAGKKIHSYLHYYPRLARTLLDFRPHVIDVWEEPWALVSAHACWTRNRVLPSAKVISETEQNIDKELPFPFGRFRSYTLRNADYGIARSTEALAVMRSRGFRGPGALIGNAVDTNLFRPMDRDTCRRRVGVDGFVVGYVGRLVEEKGLGDVIEALARCPNDVNLLVVGSGSFEAELKRKVEANGVAARVRILPGRAIEELPEVMNALDVLVIPSHTQPNWKEQFGRVIIEAHACGTPVIGSDSGAIPEVVGDGGLIVPERDPAALVRAIQTLRDDDGLRLGEAGRQRVLDHYTWERTTADLRDVYLELAGHRRDVAEIASNEGSALATARR